MAGRKKTQRMFPDVPRGPLAPRVEAHEVIGCPVEVSLGLFGQKWMVLVVRDLAFYPGITFGQILRRNRGMTHRSLSNRLRELRSEGLVERNADSNDSRVFHYHLTEKGMDAVPVMIAIASYGLRHFASGVFRDGKSRTLAQLFPGKAKLLLGTLAEFVSDE